MEWKKIEGFEKYEVSIYGQIRSLDYRLRGIIQELKPAINSAGYRTVNLYKDLKKHSLKVSRLVAMAFIPNPYNKRCVNHKDCNKENDRADNLEWVTDKENTLHAWSNNLCQSILDAENGKTVRWYNINFGEILCTASELIRQFPTQKLSSGHLSSVLNGKRSHHKQWRVII